MSKGLITKKAAKKEPIKTMKEKKAAKKAKKEERKSKGQKDSLFIELDFVIPGYRDLKIGKYVYKNIFNKTQASKLFSNPGNSKHEMYLRKMGFEKTELDDNPVYCLKSESEK